MKLAIIGDRECINYDIVCLAVKESGFQDITEIVSGGARGADRLALLYADEHKLKYTEFPAKWNDLKAKNSVIKVNQWGNKYNSNAGLVRDAALVLYSDALVAIQDRGPTPGTQYTIKLAKKKNIPVYVYEKQTKDYEYQF